MIILPAQLDGLRTLADKTIKVTFETGELTPQDLLGLMENIHQFGYLAFKKEPFAEKEKEMLDNIKSDFTFKGKTSSQRLRSVLYLMWQQNNEGFDSSVKHYEHHMDIILNQYKNNLP
jgi:hypothetical protein